MITSSSLKTFSKSLRFKNLQIIKEKKNLVPRLKIKNQKLIQFRPDSNPGPLGEKPALYLFSYGVLVFNIRNQTMDFQRLIKPTPLREVTQFLKLLLHKFNPLATKPNKLKIHTFSFTNFIHKKQIFHTQTKCLHQFFKQDYQSSPITSFSLTVDLIFSLIGNNLILCLFPSILSSKPQQISQVE